MKTTFGGSRSPARGRKASCGACVASAGVMAALLLCLGGCPGTDTLDSAAPDPTTEKTDPINNPPADQPPANNPPVNPPVNQPPVEQPPVEQPPVEKPPVEPPPVDVLPSGSLRVVTVGDSLTEGIGDADGRGYPGRLLEQIEPLRPGSSVLNLGRSGWTSGELINGTDTEPSQLDRAVAADADIACVWIGSNDLWRLYEYGPPAGTTAAGEAADLAAYTQNIETIVSRLTAAGARVYIALSDDQAKRAVSQDRATLPNTTPEEFEQMSAQVLRYNDAMRTVAQKYNATLIDFFSTTIFTDIATMDFDGIHPNAAGYDVVAGLWFAAIEPALE
ncbi:GDSL-like Lipase/Acylhydrolase [Phycisphaerae bacterium RAS1]|nr:GDSL-like Lipase/Acylhydrolase [Phycisphaerae bacterium RAS1]